MRIAMVGSRGIGVAYSGVETSVTEISIRLAQRGHEVHVFTRSRYRHEIDKMYQGVHVRFRPSINTKYLDTITHLLTSMPSAIFGAFDIVHFHALGPALFAALPRMMSKKTVVTVQGLDWKRAKWNRIGRLVLKTGEFTSARFPNATVVVSRTLQKYYEERYPTKKVFYIPNGVSLAEPVPANHIRQWGLEPRQYVLFVARLTPEKRVHTLIDAWKRVHSDIPLAIAGDNPFDRDYVQSLHERAKGLNVVFTGYQTGVTLRELYSNAYLYVLPSDIEGQPISLLEAMSYGNCSLVSDIPENAEVVEDGRGFTFRCGDVEDLAAKIETLLQQPELVSQVGKVARQYVCEHHSWDRITQATLEVYESILGKNGEKVESRK